MVRTVKTSTSAPKGRRSAAPRQHAGTPSGVTAALATPLSREMDEPVLVLLVLHRLVQIVLTSTSAPKGRRSAAPRQHAGTPSGVTAALATPLLREMDEPVLVLLVLHRMVHIVMTSTSAPEGRWSAAPTQHAGTPSGGTAALATRLSREMDEPVVLLVLHRKVHIVMTWTNAPKERRSAAPGSMQELRQELQLLSQTPFRGRWTNLFLSSSWFCTNGSHCDDIDECQINPWREGGVQPHAACINSVGSYSYSLQPLFSMEMDEHVVLSGFDRKVHIVMTWTSATKGRQSAAPRQHAGTPSGVTAALATPLSREMDEPVLVLLVLHRTVHIVMTSTSAPEEGGVQPHAACFSPLCRELQLLLQPLFRWRWTNMLSSWFCTESSYCDDIDECAQGKAKCSPQAACRNSVGSYSCSCNPPFEGYGRTCSCPPGFAQNGSHCDDMDECAQGKAECSPQAACRNSVGSYSCSCNPPFEGDGRTCSCPPGFAQNGSHCDDIDECARGKAECSPHAACRNSVGSYSCSCNPSFEGDGRTCCPPGFAQKGSHCDDMDECTQWKAECSPQAACRNSVGSYSCSCNPPFEGDGRTCSCPPGFAQNGSHCDGKTDCLTSFFLPMCYDTFTYILPSMCH
ncbi:fibulin-2-like isoform X10 [Macrobrachium rosenbergii]|uniref:fibulin-2-like isoform X10 n=1 Tax=Macrobrachium rosenbergii TaxID=79674 RepID=UPI0034D3A124